MRFTVSFPDTLSESAAPSSPFPPTVPTPLSQIQMGLTLVTQPLCVFMVDLDALKEGSQHAVRRPKRMILASICEKRWSKSSMMSTLLRPGLILCLSAQATTKDGQVEDIEYKSPCKLPKAVLCQGL